MNLGFHSMFYFARQLSQTFKHYYTRCNTKVCALTVATLYGKAIFLTLFYYGWKGFIRKRLDFLSATRGSWSITMYLFTYPVSERVQGKNYSVKTDLHPCDFFQSEETMETIKGALFKTWDQGEYNSNSEGNSTKSASSYFQGDYSDRCQQVRCSQILSSLTLLSDFNHCQTIHCTKIL